MPVLLTVVVGTLLFLFASERDASAIPAFARKYETSCLTCHTVYPVLNPFGEAFRRNGYRFPSQRGSVDSDSVKAPSVALGQEEYKKTFPSSVWPASIPAAIPLAVMFNGGVAANMPGTDAKAAAGNVFTWDGIEAELHLWGAGAFSDTLTYMAQVTLAQQGDNALQGDIETAYLLWNDIVGPPHALNLWVGRLYAPQVTSFGSHSDYLVDSRLPGVSVVGLYNPSGGFGLGQTHSDGVEASGMLLHRFAWSAGWLASSTGSGLSTTLNAEDAYVHIGIKSGGVALDGEGKYGSNVPDPAKPWAEKAITIDAYGYHGMNVLDNGTGTVAGGSVSATPQKDAFDIVGASIRAQYDSLVLDAGGQYEWHDHPYQGSAATSPSGAVIPGVPDYTTARALVAWGELDYVVWPWFVPGMRAEYTVGSAEVTSQFSLMRIIPGVAMLVRPNIRLVVTGDLEAANGAPPAGSSAPAGGAIVSPATGTKFQAETVSASAAVAF